MIELFSILKQNVILEGYSIPISFDNGLNIIRKKCEEKGLDDKYIKQLFDKSRPQLSDDIYFAGSTTNATDLKVRDNLIKIILSNPDITRDKTGYIYHNVLLTNKTISVANDRGKYVKVANIGQGTIKRSGWEPNATDMEICIAFVFNKFSDFFDNDSDNIEFVSGKSVGVGNNQNILNWCSVEGNYQNILNIVKYINCNSPLKKKNSDRNSVSNFWWEVGKYKENNKIPNDTPKTDLISADGKYRISLKDARGAQLMSGGYCESRAILLSNISYITDDNDRQRLEDMLDVKWVNVRDKSVSQLRKDNDPTIISGDEIHRNATQLINELIEKYPKFKIGILDEATTGSNKFGTNSPSTANYILVWGKHTRFETTDAFIKNILSHKLKFYVNYKAARGQVWSVLRIEIK